MEFANLEEDIEVPDRLLDEWQGIVNLLAEFVDVPGAYVMKIHPPTFEVLLASETANNPAAAGSVYDLAGHYCEHVVESGAPLHVPNAHEDPAFQQSYGAQHGIICYMGFPLLWPTGRVFGTLCVVDFEENPFSPVMRRLMEQYKSLIEAHLQLIYQNEQLRRSKARMEEMLAEIKTLREFLPICARCKRIRDEEGQWQDIEDYLREHADTEFTHGLCPACAEKALEPLDP